jgi:hypothetical protein
MHYLAQYTSNQNIVGHYRSGTRSLWRVVWLVLSSHKIIVSWSFQTIISNMSRL